MFSVTRADMDFNVDSNDTTNAATTQKMIAAYSDATPMLRQATAVQSAPVTTPSILLLPPEVRVMVWKHFFGDLTVYVRSDGSRLDGKCRVFLLASTEHCMATYSPRSLYYTSRLIRLEVTDMLWRLAKFRVSDLILRRPLPVPLSSQVRNLKLDWNQYVDIINDIQYPFLTQLDEPETPQHIQITGHDTLEHLKLTCDVHLAAGVIGMYSTVGRFFRLLYFKKPFLLELAMPVHDGKTRVQMTAIYSSDSGLQFEYATRVEKCKRWEQRIQTALELLPADIEWELQADLADGTLVGSEDHDKVKKYITSERLPAFRRAWEVLSAVAF